MSRPTVSPARTPNEWLPLGLLWVAYFLNQGDRQVFNVTVPLLKADLGFTDVEIGWIATAFTIVFGAVVPFAGVVADRFPRRYIVLISVVIFSSGTVATALASGLTMMILCRGLATGGGEGLYYPGAASLIGDHYRHAKARALSIHQTANYVGIIAGSFVAGWIADQFGWRTAFLTFGLAGLAWGFALWRGLPRDQTKETPTEASIAERPRPLGLLQVAGLMLRSPAILAQVQAFGGLVFVTVGFLTWMPTLLFEQFDLGLANAGFSSVFYHYAPAFFAVLIVGQVSDQVARRLPRFRLLVTAGGLVLSAPFIWLAGNATSTAMAFAALAGFGVFRGACDANQFAALFDYVEDENRATMTGLFLASGFIIGAVAPVLLGTLKAGYGLDVGFAVLASVAAVSGSVLLIAALTIPSPDSVRKD